MSFLPLSPQEKQTFFAKDVYRVRELFWRGQQFNSDWPNFNSACDTAIHWARWDELCHRHHMPEFADLPRCCNYGSASSDQKDKLKTFLIYLLSVKTTKTFADLI